MSAFKSTLLLLSILLFSCIFACIPTVDPDADEWEPESTTSIMLTTVLTSTSTMTSSTTTAPPTCPAGGWMLNPANNLCYFVNMPDRAYGAAQGDCAGLAAGAQLVSIVDGAENQFIYDLITATDMSANAGYYIGYMTPANVIDYMWDDGTPVGFENWNTMPFVDTAPQCAMMFANRANPAQNGKWFERDCTENHSYVCKVASIPAG